MFSDLKIDEIFSGIVQHNIYHCVHHETLSKKTFQTNLEKNMAIEHHYGQKVLLIHIKYAGNRKKAFIA